jgi:hypothetical protein
MEKEARPTPRELVAELDKITELLGLNYQHVFEEAQGKAKASHLKHIKTEIIRGHVVSRYTLVDELLSITLRRCFFGKITFKTITDDISGEGRKKYQNFNRHVLEVLSLRQKLAFVKSFVDIPPKIAKSVGNLNTLRNGLAHSFFPEDRYDSKPEYKGKSIFTLDGLETFEDDMEQVRDYFVSLA